MSDPFASAVETLRGGLPALGASEYLAGIQSGRDEVYARYGRSFAPERLAQLSAEEYQSFLRFENNRHWTNIGRHSGRTTRDMAALRAGLALLLDEERPLAERYDQATGMISGIGRAIATAILHVVDPGRYGVWNTKVEAGLETLDIAPPPQSQATEGEQYAAVNDVLLRLAAALQIDLWTLDNLWEWLSQRKPLAAPFDAIFDGRAQAEWAFDLFADAVQRLGGGPNDPRFALTLRKSKKRMRLNIGNSMVMDIANRGQIFNLTALIEPMEEAFADRPWDRFSGESSRFGIFKIPVEQMSEQPESLQAIYEQSMAQFGHIFNGWIQTNLSAFHVPEIFAALFDEEKREQLLTNGLSATSPEFPAEEQPMPPSLPATPIAREFKGFTAGAFDFLRDLAANNNKAWMDANRERWKASVREPMRDLFADLGPHVKPLFDPYLLPDELEIAPTAHKVLARIYKNWAATPGSEYYEYFWGAFYRQSLSRQTDAQLFVTITPTNVRFGFYMGEQDNKLKRRLKERILANREVFFNLLTELGLLNNFDFVRANPDNRWQMSSIRTAEELATWVEEEIFDVLMAVPAAEAVAAGPALADTVLEAFRRVFPIYLWAVADEPEEMVERYLAAEFPSGEEDEDDDEAPLPYDLADFIRETYLTPAAAEDLRAMLHHKQQAIFYGPPGTGKTYVAQQLARLLTGLAAPPPERVELVQFHPAYGYEEFIEGIRPEIKEVDGQSHVAYSTIAGSFVRFCAQAARIKGPCVFIIDEINRGNIPRIFGELMYLLEYRDEAVPLPYSGNSGRRFRIPRNVYIIGTMNTADRSIALVDFALRRRFHFAHFAADPALYERWLDANPISLPYLGRLYRALATRAIDDPDYAIGPSQFMDAELDEARLRRVWRWSVMPYLREYYVDNSAKADAWEWDGTEMRRLRGVAADDDGMGGRA